jgi:hypothetical protein
MNRAEQLTADLKAHNNGLHYLKAKDRTECVDELCSEIDQLRSRLTAAGDMAKALEASKRRFEMLGHRLGVDIEVNGVSVRAAINDIDAALARWSAANKGGVA